MGLEKKNIWKKKIPQLDPEAEFRVNPNMW